MLNTKRLNFVLQGHNIKSQRFHLKQITNTSKTMVTNEQIKDLDKRLDALRRFL